MFSRHVRVEYEAAGKRLPCPIKWLDSFAMRSFTNSPVFDDTLPITDGAMEIGVHVPLPALHQAMEDWFRRKSYIAADAHLVLEEVPRAKDARTSSPLP